mgnify:CR=1 FL=1
MLNSPLETSKENSPRFCTAVNCMDGRVQLPIIAYLRKRFDCEYVDSITEGGPNLILAKQRDDSLVQSILARLRISIENHNSLGIAIVGHYDCAANSESQPTQIAHIQQAARFLKCQYHNLQVIGLWVDKHWIVHEVMEQNHSGN